MNKKLIEKLIGKGWTPAQSIVVDRMLSLKEKERVTSGGSTKTTADQYTNVSITD
jgi:hypothetical protein